MVCRAHPLSVRSRYLNTTLGNNFASIFLTQTPMWSNAGSESGNMDFFPLRTQRRRMASIKCGTRSVGYVPTSDIIRLTMKFNHSWTGSARKKRSRRRSRRRSRSRRHEGRRDDPQGDLDLEAAVRGTPIGLNCSHGCWRED